MFSIYTSLLIKKSFLVFVSTHLNSIIRALKDKFKNIEILIAKDSFIN
jgi:hypothetical protein